MANAMLHQTVGSLHLLSNSGIHCEVGNNSVRLLPKGFKVDVGFSKRGTYSSGERKFSVIQASASQTSVFDPVLSPSKNGTHESRKKSSKPDHCRHRFIFNLHYNRSMHHCFFITIS